MKFPEPAVSMGRIGLMRSLLLICPLCGLPLPEEAEKKGYVCGNGHSYDRARQGYVNLLISNMKKSREPGDSKEMLTARRQFLDAGHYRKVSDCVNSQMKDFLRPGNGKETALLDIGCGEGYYTSRLLKDWDPSDGMLYLYGLDISKDAVKMAAGRDKEIRWMVASSRHIPMANCSVDGAYSVFSPIDGGELKRIIRPGGVFLRVLPGLEHLIELRQLIYSEVAFNEAAVEPRDNGLTRVDITPLRYAIRLCEEEIAHLLKMTPHYWKTTKEQKDSLRGLAELTVTVDMNVLIYRV